MNVIIHPIFHPNVPPARNLADKSVELARTAFIAAKLLVAS